MPPMGLLSVVALEARAAPVVGCRAVLVVKHHLIICKVGEAVPQACMGLCSCESSLNLSLHPAPAQSDSRLRHPHSVITS